jgi:hypothetical protein
VIYWFGSKPSIRKSQPIKNQILHTIGASLSQFCSEERIRSYRVGSVWQDSRHRRSSSKVVVHILWASKAGHFRIWVMTCGFSLSAWCTLVIAHAAFCFHLWRISFILHIVTTCLLIQCRFWVEKRLMADWMAVYAIESKVAVDQPWRWHQKVCIRIKDHAS